MFWFSRSNFCPKHFSFYEELSEIWSKIYIGLHVRHSLMKLEFPRQIFEKILKYKISRNSVQWEKSCSMRTDGRTYMTKLIVAFRNFANAPKYGKLWLNKENTNYGKDTCQQEVYQKKAQIKIFFPLIPTPLLVSSVSGFIFRLTVMRIKKIFTARKKKSSTRTNSTM